MQVQEKLRSSKKLRVLEKKETVDLDQNEHIVKKKIAVLKFAIDGLVSY